MRLGLGGSTDSGDNARKACRAMFTLPRGRQQPDPLARELCGTVVDLRTRRALVTPHAPLASTKFAKKGLNACLTHTAYTMHTFYDGTVLTLYSWEPFPGEREWALASSGGYDVTTFKWMGPSTFAQLLVELAGRLAPRFAGAHRLRLGEGGRVECDLPPGEYTFDMRHHSFHPLRSDPEHLVLLRAPPGLDPLDLERGASSPCPPGATYETLLAEAEAGGHYGYVLVSADPGVTKEFHAVRIETTKIRQIRSLVYDATRNYREVDPEERMSLCAAKAMLHPDTRALFLSYFPDWAPFAEQFHGLVLRVRDETASRCWEKTMAPHARVLKSDSPAVEACVSKILDRMGALIKDPKNMVMTPDLRMNLVMGFILLPEENALLFLRTLVALRREQVALLAE